MKKILRKIMQKKKFEQVLYEWLLLKKDQVKSSTYNKYLFQIENHIIPYLGKLGFKKIKSKDIVNFFNNKMIKMLSDSTKNTILIIINSTIDYGISKKYRSEFTRVSFCFKKEQYKASYFTKKEQSQIEGYIKKNMNLRNLIILVALYSGARLGELCALRGSDVDFINNTIAINKSVQRGKCGDSNNKTKLIVGIPKTKNSCRIIPAPKFIIELLKNYVKDPNNYIFTNSNKPKDPRAVEKYFRNLLDKLNINQLNFHALRHTFATRLREQKVDIKVISELLGHANWKITQSVYVHASIDYKKASIDELAHLWERKNRIARIWLLIVKKLSS